MNAQHSGSAVGSVLVDDFREHAKGLLKQAIFDYIDASAVDGLTSRANRGDFDRLSLLPLAMRDVSTVDYTRAYFGKSNRLPIGISPMAFHQLAHPEGELATAGAALHAGAPMVVSAMSSRLLEDVAAHAKGASLWLHVYLFRDKGLTRDLISRAEDAGYEAITLGLGCPALGKRPVNLRNGFTLPDDIRAVNLAGDGRDRQGLSWVNTDLDAAATWADVEAVCRQTKLPVIGKGVMNPLDVAPALGAGLSGLMVSNHGGRQLDGACSTIRALPGIVAAVNGRVPVFLDGGIRRGTDVLKAMLLGADGVFVGRPVLWALSTSGGAGVAELLSILTDELRLAMQLSGVASIKEARSLAKDLLHWT